MLLVHAEDATVGERLAGVTPEKAFVTACWSEFRIRLGSARLAVVAYSGLDVPVLQRRIHAIRRGTHAPVIVILPFAEPHARLLAAVVVDGVVWEHEIDSPETVRTILEPVATALIDRFAETVLAARGAPAANNRNIVAGLCGLSPPPRDVHAASVRLAVSRSALRRQVARAFTDLGGLSPHEFLEWLRLLWVCDPSRHRTKQLAIGRALGRTARTLQRTARKLTGKSLAELREDPEWLLQSALRRFVP
jgi:hypothetical protein